MKIFFSLLLILSSLTAWSEDSYLLCTYKGTKQIKMVDTNKIQRHEKTLPNGVKQIIVINDPWTLTDFENYTVLSNGEHTMTYSLHCVKHHSKESK